MTSLSSFVLTQPLFSGRKSELPEGFDEWTPQMKLVVDIDKKERERVRKKAKRAQHKEEFVALQRHVTNLQNEVTTFSVQNQALVHVYSRAILVHSRVHSRVIALLIGDDGTATPT